MPTLSLKRLLALPAQANQQIRAWPGRGFTLIELLVVISIIGLLSSVVLASLSGARDKGRIASGILFADHNYQAFGADAIGYWNFNEGTDPLSTPAKDLSGHNRTMTSVGIVNRNNTTPIGSGSALSIVRSGGYAQASGLSGNDLQPASITISAWIYFTDLTTNSNGSIVNVDVGENSPAITIEMVNGVSRCSSIPFATNTVFNTWDTGKWYHLACSVKSVPYNIVGTPHYNAQMTTYVDGKQFSQAGGLGNPNSYWNGYGSINTVMIGAGGGYDTSNIPFSEYIDDVAVYSSALTASQIHEIYAEQAPQHQFAANVK